MRESALQFWFDPCAVISDPACFQSRRNFCWIFQAGENKRETNAKGEVHARVIGFPLAREMILQVKQFRPQRTVKRKWMKRFIPGGLGGVLKYLWLRDDSFFISDYLYFITNKQILYVNGIWFEWRLGEEEKTDPRKAGLRRGAGVGSR